MKLILCAKCWDVVKLDKDVRTCKCGLCKGRYIDDIVAEVNKPAIPVYINNHSLVTAVLYRKNNEETLFEGGVFGRKYKNIKVLKE
tara:strand:- start:319 stop:576 length:258 start_codon:yes stop_codon:yes gene_type:complete